MRSRQFTSVPLACPNCGFHIGNQAYFQSFEQKVALWLKGEIAPIANPKFDVEKCESFPGLKFQVKYSNPSSFIQKGKNYITRTWSWNTKRYDQECPNYFILFGIDEDETENVFVLSNKDFYSLARKNKSNKSFFPYGLSVSAKKRSDKRNSSYLPQLWKYHTRSPEVNLIKRIHRYEKGLPFEEEITLPAFSSIDNNSVSGVLYKYSLLGYTQKELMNWSKISKQRISRMISEERVKASNRL